MRLRRRVPQSSRLRDCTGGSDRAGARTAIDADFGDASGGDLDPRRHVAALEQLAQHRLALGLNSRPQRLIEGLGSQRAGDLHIDMLLSTIVQHLPPVHIAIARDRYRCGTADDLKIAGHAESMTGASARKRAWWAISSPWLWT